MAPAPYSGGTLPPGVYNVDYWYWLGLPGNTDPINCDNANGCFWYNAVQLNTSAAGVALHTGPMRGVALGGNSGGQWKIDVSGYDNGGFAGGLTSTVSPSGKWVRLRTWRTGTGWDVWGRPTATWGVWAMWDGVDRYAGSVTFRGTDLSGSMLFTEIYETNGPCFTDFERTYFDNPVYRSTSGGPWAINYATADYQATCSNTTWKSLGGDFVVDERDVSRVIPQGARIW